MTPSSIQSKLASKKPPASSTYAASASAIAENGSTHVQIDIHASRTQQLLQYALATLALLAPINAQLPLLVTGFIALWTVLAMVHSHCSSNPCLVLVDEGEQWLMKFASHSDRVRYEHADYCSARLLVMRFRTRSGKIRRVCIWHDAVTQSAFSWLAARITLTSPDTKVKIVATS